MKRAKPEFLTFQQENQPDIMCQVCDGWNQNQRFCKEVFSDQKMSQALP